MERWAKVPILWAESEMVCDPIRVWLAISDQTRGAKRAKISMEHVLKSTKLDESRVMAGIRSLEQMKAISFADDIVEMKPSISRTRVNRTPLKNISLEQQGVSKVIDRSKGGDSTRIRVEDTFEERNRLAKVRTKAIRWINDYFEQPGWHKVNRKKRFWGKLQGLFADELVPDMLRRECESILKERGNRETTKRENKGAEADSAGLHRESRDNGNGAVDNRHGAGLSGLSAGTD